MAAEDSPTWLEYQRRHADELDEGRRAMERIAAHAADSGDEPYTSTGLRPLLVGGQESHAVRIDPKTRMCDNATATGKSRRGATGQTSEAQDAAATNSTINLLNPCLHSLTTLSSRLHNYILIIILHSFDL